MKSKSLSDATTAVKKFFNTSGLHEFNSKASVIIMSDSDSAFKGDSRDELEEQNFQKVLSDKNAVLEPVKLNDHRALVVIDVFAKDLKRVLSKEFLENKSTEWVSILPKITQHHN